MGGLAREPIAARRHARNPDRRLRLHRAGGLSDPAEAGKAADDALAARLATARAAVVAGLDQVRPLGALVALAITTFLSGTLGKETFVILPAGLVAALVATALTES